MIPLVLTSFFFFFNDTATTEIYTLSLHDALPISWRLVVPWMRVSAQRCSQRSRYACASSRLSKRSEEHTSELQSLTNLVCRLLLEKKKKTVHHDLDVRDDMDLCATQMTYTMP